MSNWVTITDDDIKAATVSNLVEAARNTAAGTVDPVVETIANVIAEVRTAVRAGNRLDTDETKIPLSLKRLAVRLIIAALSIRIGNPLSEDEQKQKTEDEKRLERLMDRKLVVEPADDPAPIETSGPVNPGLWNSERKIIGRTHPVPPPTSQYPPGTGYANPDAPEDSDV